MSRLNNARKFRKEFEASKNVARQFILISEIPQEEISSLIKVYDEYEVNKDVIAGYVFRYGDKLFKVLQAHKTAEQWKPNEAVSLYVEVKLKIASGGEEIVAPWEVRPTENLYMIGDKVLWTNGKIYESTINNNSWNPETYPQGWKEVI